MRLFIWLIFILYGLSFSSAVQCRDLIVARAILEDPTGALTIAEVVNAKFETSGAILTKGYTNSVHWLRIDVHTPSPNTSIRLLIRPTFLDDVQLYAAAPNHLGAWVVRKTGDLLPFSARNSTMATLSFNLTSPSSVSTYYIRLKTDSASILYVEALLENEAVSKDLFLTLWQVSYEAVLLLLLMWLINDFWVHREATTGIFLFFQTWLLLYFLAISGGLSVLMPDIKAGVINNLTNFLVCSITIAGLLFHRIQLRLFVPPYWMLWVLNAQIAAGCAILLLLIFGDTRLALQLNGLNLLLIAPTLLLLAWFARHEVLPGLSRLRTVYTLQSLVYLVSLLPLLGVVSAREWQLNGPQNNSLAISLLFFSLLYSKSKALSRQVFKSKLELALAHQQINLEKSRQKLQAHFLAMLTHELKIPMSIVRMVIGTSQLNGKAKERIELAVHDMAQIVDRCSQVDALENDRLTPHAEPLVLADMLDELIIEHGASKQLNISLHELPIVNTDSQLLRTALSNLIGNALKYAVPASPIQLIAQQVESDGKEGVQITVSNKPGQAGFPDPSRVFEKYYRSPGAQHRSGSGQGLFLVKKCAELIGGKVNYTIQYEQVEFTLWIPV